MPNILNKPPSFRKIIGPSIILLGLGLGSGELILWPYMISNYGLGIIWAAILGITFQFFVNMEIERYSLLRGESIFAGFSRLSKKLPYWFIFSTFIAWMWPGIIATSAEVFSVILGIESFEIIAIFLLLLIGIILTLGPHLYKTVESFQKVLIAISIPLIAIITFLLARNTDFLALANGLVGIGEGYRFLPSDIHLFTLLGAIAYSGAGGNLNLAQSFYIKEKGYGMCRGVRGITSILTGKANDAQIYGKAADFKNKENYLNFKKWWRVINLEHAIVFWCAGAFSIILLALLAYITTYGVATQEGVVFLVKEYNVISTLLGPVLGVFFMILIGALLFGTQLTVLDSTSRIIAENFVILKKNINLSKIYYFILWFQIIAGILVFSAGYRDPISLVVTGAVINAFAMFFHIAITYVLNQKMLSKEYRISTYRKIILLVAWVFFGILSLWALGRVFV